MKIAAFGGRSLVALAVGLGSLLGGCGGGKTQASGGGTGHGGTPVDDAGKPIDEAGMETTDGSESAAGFPQVLFTFDSTAGDTYGWQTGAPSSVALVSDDRDPNNPTPGSLEFRAVFPPYDSTGMADSVSTAFAFGDPTTGTKSFAGATKFHFWIRLVSFPAPFLLALQPFTQGGAPDYPGSYNSYNQDIPDDQWREYVVDVAGEPYLDRVFQLVIQLAPAPLPVADAEAMDTAEGGASAPPPVVVHIDYIWVD